MTRLFDQAAADGAASGTAAAAEGAAAEGAAAEGAAAEGAAAEGAAAAAEGAAAEGAAAAGDKPAGAPEQYADFTLPEGVTLAPAVLDDVKSIAKDLNLPQDAAQKLADLGARMAQGNEASIESKRQEFVTEWETAAKNDKEIGGDKFDESLATAKKALDTFGTPELINFLEETKLGSYPEMLRTFHRIGKAISEDALVVGEGRQQDKDPLSTMYPSMAK